MKENNRRSSSTRFPRRNTSRAKRQNDSPEVDAAGKKPRQPFDGEKQLYEVIKVRLVHSKRLIEVSANDKLLMPNTLVLVKVGRNLLLANTVGHRYRAVVEANSLPYVVRIASQSDVVIDSENLAIETRAQKIATQYSLDKKLQMKVLSADLSHDRKNITINFASDVRVDFREMVAFLSSELKLRVEMFQLGLRSGTGLLCGLGSCGESLCCSRFLGQFEPVAVKLLRAQGLATNPKRISGVCGRLYCCLSYEYSDYLKDGRPLPKKGRKLLTRLGIGRVIDSDPIREEVVVAYENGETQRLTLSDFVVATEDVLAKNEAGGFEFPLDPARFYLNNDPSAAVDMGQRLKVKPAANSANARSRHGRTAKIQTERNDGVSRRPKLRNDIVASDPNTKRKELPNAGQEDSTDANKKKRSPRQRRSPRPPIGNVLAQAQGQAQGQGQSQAQAKPRPPRRRPTNQNRDANTGERQAGELRTSAPKRPMPQQDGPSPELAPRTELSEEHSSRRVRRTRQSKDVERGDVTRGNEQRSLAKPDLSTVSRPRREAKPEERDSNAEPNAQEVAPRRQRRRRPAADGASTTNQGNPSSSPNPPNLPKT